MRGGKKAAEEWRVEYQNWKMPDKKKRAPQKKNVALKGGAIQQATMKEEEKYRT